MAAQNYKNHHRYVPLYHFVHYTIITGCLAGAGWNAYNAFCYLHHGRLIAAVLGGFSIAFFLITWYAREFALKAQDRAIRAEENLRHFALAGKLLDKRITMGQTIALRFAPDEEFVALAQRTANEGLKPNAIKEAITNWREDNHRV